MIKKLPPQIHLICYGSGRYVQAQKRLVRIAESMGFASITAYDRAAVRDTPFYEKNRKILSQSRGDGYWLWKSYLILKALEGVKDGDAVFYCDVGDRIKPGIKGKIEAVLGANNGIYLCRGTGTNGRWTKRDCFVLMGCDSEQYWDKFQVEAGTMAWVKCERSFQILREWQQWCTNEQAVTDTPNVHGENLPGFMDHRHDQSIMSLLAIKHGLEIVSFTEMARYIDFNANESGIFR